MMNMQVRIKMYWKKKNDALNKAQKNFQNKFKDYSKAMNTVNKEKQDVDNL